MLKRLAPIGLAAFALLITLMFSAPTPAYAATCSYVGIGIWENAGNWNCTPGGAVVPAATDDVMIPGGGNSVYISASVTRSASTTNNLMLVVNTGGTLINNSTITNNGTLHINSGGTLINYGTIQLNNSMGNAGTLINCGTINGAGTVTINPPVTSPCPPIAGFNFSANNLNVVFTDTSTHTPTSWGWTFGDGGISPLQNPSHIYSTPGTYPVCLTATNAGGSDTACVNVTVSAGKVSQGVAISPNAPVETPPDDRLNWKHGDTYARVFVRSDDSGNPAVHVYCLNHTEQGTIALVVTQEDVNGVIGDGLVQQSDLCHATFHVLATGEYQVTVGPDFEGKHYAYIFRDLNGAGFYWREFNTLDIVQ